MQNNSLNQKVLILNRNYQPVMVTGVKRAIILAFLDKVDVLEHYNEWVHSPSISLQLPSVVKLKRYTPFNLNDVALSRRNILQRDRHTCQYCGKTSVSLTIDHVIPRHRGGKDIWENLVAACVKCNNIKGDRTPEESGMILLNRPKKPSFIFYFQQFVNKKQGNWRPYLFMDSMNYN